MRRKKARRKSIVPQKRNNQKRSIPKRWKRLKRKPLIAALLAVVIVLAVMVFLAERGAIRPPVTPNPTVSAFSNVKITLPEFTEEVLLCSKAAKLEYDGAISLEAAVEAGNPYRPFFFEYCLENCSGTLYLGEKEDLSDACQYAMEETKQYIAIDNLKVDTTYYYKVVANHREFFGNFHTAAATRFVHIPGLVNTRDIGGGVTLDGKKVKQGLLIRGVELDGLVYASYFIPEEELKTVQNQFDFVYDLDLRQPNVYSGVYTSRLGVSHDFYTSPQYGEIFSESWHGNLKSIFSALADSGKYPMYLHCTWGKDRTGTIIFLLQGVLNMSEEDMKREYQLSSYEHPSIFENNNIDVIASGLESYEGDSLQDKIRTFLITEIGVTAEEISTIRSIFLEE